MANTFLVLDQYRESSEYNDFTGKFYHFPKKYLNFLSKPNIEFVYYEPRKNGKGEYYGYGKIKKAPFEDKREPDFYFVEIIDFKPFSVPVPFENENEPREKPPFYNPQNAVRQISKETLEEICLDGGIQLNFKADAHLIKVLGEQLIASEKVGILELIKNSYDAGATYCKVIIEKVDTLPKIDASLFQFKEYAGPVIVIEDDGIGMTKEAIENGWLRPASTLKTNIKERLKKEKLKAIEADTLGTYKSFAEELKKEYKGRIPLGEKGVGRFATNRLGRNLIIKTKVKDLDYEYVLKINWDIFDNISSDKIDLDSIGVNITRQKPSRNYGKTNSGTQMIVYGSREEFCWDRNTIEELNLSIIRLNSPSPNPNSLQDKKSQFKAFLECPQLPDLKDESLANKIPSAFSFDGLVNENGILDYTLIFTPSPNMPMVVEKFSDESYDLKKGQISYWKKDDDFRKPECGEFYIHLDVWYRSEPWIDGPNKKNFTGYLDNFGGISIYRDGINIFPAEWGAEIDWLKLKTRHIKQGFRISYYNMIGNLEIDQINNLDLIDKTDREGLIKNKAYNDLVNLIRPIITTIIENEFRGKRDKYDKLTGDIIKDPKVLKNFSKQSEKIVSNIREKYPIIEDTFSILSELGTPDQREGKLINLERSLKNLQESLDLIINQKELLTEQAGFGLAIAVSVHEIAKITSNFYYGVNEILKKGKIDKNKLEELKDVSNSIKTELSRLNPTRVIRNESKIEFNIAKSINFVFEVFKNKFNILNITFELDSEQDFQVFARYGATIQIFSNLFENSCYWLNYGTATNRKIKIHLDSKYRTIIVADNAQNIGKSILPYLFQPGYSLKDPPSGLGLYICKYYMQSMEGDIYLTNSRERLSDMPGAQFSLDFGKIPSNKEEI
ncbi:MAG: sensor histidine kinase [bacterium]|nr:sensor histidine kinase [bacterium]